MFEKRRLHPLALIKELIIKLRDFIIPIGFGVFSFFKYTDGVLPLWMYIFISLVLILLLFLLTVLKYLFFSYTLEDKGIRIRQGLIFRKNIYIPYERIQTVQQKQWFFFMPFNVTQVTIETAGNTKETEGKLSVVPISVVEELKDLSAGENINTTQPSSGNEVRQNELATAEDNDKTNQITTLKIGHLILMSITSNSVFSGFIIIFSLVIKFDIFIPTGLIDKGATYLWQMGITVILIVFIITFFVTWVIAIISTLFKYFHFKLSKYENRLIIEKGLLQHNYTTIQLERIQGVILVESPFRQMLGFAAVKLITASATGDEKNSSDLLILPIIRKSKVADILQQMLPDYQLLDGEVQKAPTRSLARFLFIYIGWAIIPTLILAIWLYPYGLVGLILLILAAIKAICSYRATSFLTTKQSIMLTARPVISKMTYIVRKERIQSMYARQAVWLKRHKLCHFKFDIKSGMSRVSPYIRYISTNSANELCEWYRPRPK